MPVASPPTAPARRDSPAEPARASRSYPRPLAITVDALAWSAAITSTALLVGLVEPETGTGVASAVLFTVVAQLVAGLAIGLYRRRWLPGSLAEAHGLVASALVAGLAASVAPLVSPGQALPTSAWPPSLPLVAFPVAALIMAGTRTLVRGRVERALRPRPDAAPTLVFGTGVLGEHLVRQLLTDPTSPLRPVELLDDDPTRRGLRIAGITITGGRDELADAARRTGAETLVLAVARADAALVRDLTERASAIGLRILTVPPLDDLLTGGSSTSDLRDVSVEDIVGRRPVDTDVESIADYVRGRRVLVTGAGGSIGSELCRQLSRFAPAELMMLDRDETALQSVQVTLSGHGLLDTRDVVLADIRDATALTTIFRARRPEVVFHAAALKHLPMLEQYPAEAWQTNVMGTLNVLEAAAAVDVETFVNISTDKAANPTSVLGRSKRLAERLTAGAAEKSGRRYLSVRFGNVLGSRGSMVPLFRDLIATGRPLTVTHPDATRFFMTIPEACHLVIQAGAIGGPGEALILDMGEPVKILDVAERMIALSGRDVDVVFTGLRPGEKLHEELNGVGEDDVRPVHPLISHATVPPLDASDLDVDAVLTDPPPEAFRPVATT